MSRATDICTCGKSRVWHERYKMDHDFFPHPQPNLRPPLSLDVRLRNWLANQGACTVSEGDVHRPPQFFVTLPNGEKWEITAFRRSSEGV